MGPDRLMAAEAAEGVGMEEAEGISSDRLDPPAEEETAVADLAERAEMEELADAGVQVPLG